jgi:tetratricopeptide (TPR) repeat protein
MLTALDANNREEYWDDNKKSIPRVLGKLLKLLDGLEFENGLYVGDSVTNWEAIAAFQGALARDDHYPDVHYHLARCLDENGSEQDAAKHWIRFLQLSPQSPWADEALDRLGRL